MKPIRFIQLLTLFLALITAVGLVTEAHAQAPDANQFTLYIPASLKEGKVTTTPPPTGDKLPAELVTTWYAGVAPMVDFYNPITGEWGDTGGLGEMYKFSANGDFIYAGFLRLQNGQCLTEVSTYREGKVKTTAAQLTLTPALAKTRTVIRCGSNSDSTTDGPFDPVKIGYDVSENNSGLIQLTLTDKGNSTSYYREGMVESLVGKWTRGGVSSDHFYDKATKRFSEQSDAGAWYHFEADGSYTFGEYGFGTDDKGCALTAWIYVEGTVAIAGSKLTTIPAAGVQRLDNACHPGAPQVTTFDESERAYTWMYRDRTSDQKLVIIPLDRFQEFIFTPE